MIKTVTDIQIRFGDVDILGHVNNVNLQHYYDLGKSEYYTSILGLHTFDGTGDGVIVASTETNYLAQTRPGEKIYVETSVEKIGTKSMVFLQRIISRENGEVKSESRSVMVGFDFSAQQTIPIPYEWKLKTGL